jgi:type II secretory pathway component PulC
LFLLQKWVAILKSFDYNTNMNKLWIVIFYISSYSIIAESIQFNESSRNSELIKDMLPLKYDTPDLNFTLETHKNTTVSWDDFKKSMEELGFYKNVKFGPHFENGKITGYKIYKVGEGSLFFKYGIRANDIIKQINGYAINGSSVFLKVIYQTKILNHIIIDIETDKKMNRLEYQFTGKYYDFMDDEFMKQVNEEVARSSERKLMNEEKIPNIDNSELNLSISESEKISTSWINYKNAIEGGGIYKDSRFGPLLENGKVVGYKFYEVKENSISYRFGLRNNDIVKQINGYSLTGNEILTKIFEEMKVSNRVVLDIERENKFIRIDITFIDKYNEPFEKNSRSGTNRYFTPQSKLHKK